MSPERELKMEVNEKLRNLQLVELELFKKFCKVAKENKIRYLFRGMMIWI